MKKLMLLLPCLWGFFGFVEAQSPNPDSAAVFKQEAINWQLDSLMPCYHFETIADSLFDRQALNLFNYPADSVPVFTSAVLADRIKSMKTVIPMEYNSYVHAFINLYSKRRRDQVERMLGLSHLYFPIFEAELDRQRMPMELKYLPVVESALNPHARSRVGATGLWQFMLATGKIYGLQVTSYMDERRDPYKSTEAACRYLKNMYKTYGDWLLVIAAYNCGPGNVNKAISRSGGKRTFWEIRDKLPRETRSYVPAFIAAAYVFEHAAEHNLYARQVNFTFAQDTMVVKKRKFNLQHLATVTNTDFYALRDLNPELQRDIVPYSNQAYTLRIPMKTGQLIAAKQDSVFAQLDKMNPDKSTLKLASNKISPLTNKPYAKTASSSSSPAGKSLVYHRVRSGETVSSIASRYRVSWKQVKAWNHLRGYRIKPGQRLKVYVPSNSRYASGSTSKPKSKPKVTTVNGAKYYTVRSGDTLWDIAQSQKTTVASIKSLNSLHNSRLKPGMKLRVD